MHTSSLSRDEDDIDFLALWEILNRYRIWILGVTAAFAFASIVLALLLTPIFRATTVVSEITGTSNGMSGLAERYGGLAALAGFDLGSLTSESNTSFATLNSRMLVEQFIRQNDLVPVLFPDATGDEMPTLWEAVEYFRDNVLSISADQANGVVMVTVDWTDPVVAADWSTSIVRLANDIIRTKATTEAETSLAYLNQKLLDTSVVELKQVLYSMVVVELQTLMLANARPEFAFVTIDPAVVPEERHRPNRTLVVILGALFGGIVSIFVVMGHHLVRSQKSKRVHAVHRLASE